ncbi:MAG: hypothetical protein J6C81_03740 [Muribaculaceae bacterium]|nr:hypothetical protein [Muribaculaceae bacterium]
MITEEVLKDIYKQFKKPVAREELNLDYFIDMLSKHHSFVVDDDEIIIENLEELNPFRRFLKRAIYVILEFDKNVAFVFENHIIFFGKENNSIRVYFRPEKENNSIFSRLFGSR